MAAIDLTLCQKQVIALLNAGQKNGTYSTVVEDKRFLASDQIKEVILESDEEVVLAIMESPSHGLRAGYMSWSAALNYGDEIPDHIGEHGSVQILISSGGAYEPSRGTATIEEIEMWRDTSDDTFGQALHDAANSPLGGYYNIIDGVIYFTGYRAAVRIATYTRNNSACQAPDIYMPSVVAGALAKLHPKEGGSLAKAQYYLQMQQFYLTLIRGNAKEIPDVQAYQEAKG